MNDPACPRPSWHPATRIAFRFSFIYLLLYLVMNGNATVFAAIPFVGFPIQAWFAAPGRSAAVWLGQHVFHLTGIAARWHGGGSGDTALNYLCILAFGLAALLATLVWSALDWRRTQYSLLHAWLRFLLRLTVGVGMLVYGFAKLFPMQMREPSYAILNNTYGRFEK